MKKDKIMIELDALFRYSIEIEQARRSIREKMFWDIKELGLENVKHIYKNTKVKEFRIWLEEFFPEEIK